MAGIPGLISPEIRLGAGQGLVSSSWTRRPTTQIVMAPALHELADVSPLGVSQSLASRVRDGPGVIQTCGWSRRKGMTRRRVVADRLPFARFVRAIEPPSDVLDGVGFREQVRRECKRADVLGRPLSLLAGWVHVDRPAGNQPGRDPPLEMLADVLDRWTRRGDPVTQFDEVFVVLLADSGRVSAGLVAQRLARAADRYLDDRGLPGIVGFGHATYPDDGRELDGLLHTALTNAADRAAARAPNLHIPH
jgi:hypothetical protein